MVPLVGETMRQRKGYNTHQCPNPQWSLRLRYVRPSVPIHYFLFLVLFFDNDIFGGVKTVAVLVGVGVRYDTDGCVQSSDDGLGR